MRGFLSASVVALCALVLLLLPPWMTPPADACDCVQQFRSYSSYSAPVQQQIIIEERYTLPLDGGCVQQFNDGCQQQFRGGYSQGFSQQRFYSQQLNGGHYTQQLAFQQYLAQQAALAQFNGYGGGRAAFFGNVRANHQQRKAERAANRAARNAAVAQRAAFRAQQLRY